MVDKAGEWAPAPAFRIDPQYTLYIKRVLSKAGLLDKVFFLKRKSFVDLMVSSDTDLISRIHGILEIDKVSSL